MSNDMGSKLQAFAASEGQVVRDADRSRPVLRATPAEGRGGTPDGGSRERSPGAARLDAWGRWVVVCALGHLLGLGAVGLAGWRALRVGGGASDVGASMPVNFRDVACAAEGAIVGALQWSALRGPLPEVVRSEWVFATATGAFVASALGLVPWTLAGAGADLLPALPPALAAPARYAAAAGLGAVAGLVLSVLQGWVLRRLGARVGRWLAANALGWSAATPLLVWASRALGRVQGAASAALVLFAALFAGAIVGAALGAVGFGEPRAGARHARC